MKQSFLQLVNELAWKKKKTADIFAAPPLLSQRNDVWGTTAEIQYWRRVTAHI